MTLARLSRVLLDIGLLKRQLMAATCLNFEAIEHQLVAGTYNVPAPSHIIRSVLVSYIRENPAMTAEVTPDGLCNHNAQGLVRATEHCVRWGSGSPPPREGARRRVGFPIVKYRRSAPSHVLFDGKFHQAVAG